MSERSRSTQRILAVQRTLRDLAEWKLAAAERLATEAAAARTALDSFVETANLTGSFATYAMRETRRLTLAERDAETRRETLADKARQVEARFRLAERMAATIAADDRQTAERRDLERLIESFGSVHPAGHPDD